MSGPFNIFITGVGGQGVVTLAHALRLMFHRERRPVTGAVLKGGAQRLGTVSASLRAFAPGAADYEDYALDIPQGQLDLAIGLEPWECLRASRLFGEQTQVVVNRVEVPLLVARTRDIDIDDPVAELEKSGVSIQAADYAQLAVEEFGDDRMLNYVMGKAAVNRALPEFGVAAFDESFLQVVDRG